MRTSIFVTLIIIILAGGYYGLFKATNPESVVNEPVVEAPEIKTKQLAHLQFSYRESPDGYVLVPSEGVKTKDKIAERYLYNKAEYEELKNSEIPREGPPFIAISVFENEDGDEPLTWAKAHRLESNINLAVGEPTPIGISGLTGIKYRADGLYPFEVYIITCKTEVYVLTGFYLEATDQIRADFEDLISSLVFK